MTTEIQTTPRDWAGGQLVLSGYAVGQTDWTYRATLFAALQVMESGERVRRLFKDVVLEVGPASALTTDNVGGSAEGAAELVKKGGPNANAGIAYLACVGAVRNMTTPGVGWHRVTDLSDPGGDPFPPLGALPLVPITIAVVGVAAVAAAAWGGSEAYRHRAAMKQAVAIASIQAKQYADDVGARLAANQAAGKIVAPLPNPSPAVKQLADQEIRWKWWQLGAGVVLGGMAVYGVTQATKKVAARRNPARAPVARRRPRLSSSATTRSAPRKRLNPAKKKPATRKSVTKRKPNPKKIVSPKRKPATKRNPRKKAATKRKANPHRKKTSTKKSNPHKKKVATKRNPRDRFGRPSGKGPKATFVRGQMSKGRSAKQAENDWKFKRRMAAARRKNPAKKRAPKKG